VTLAQVIILLPFLFFFLLLALYGQSATLTSMFFSSMLGSSAVISNAFSLSATSTTGVVAHLNCRWNTGSVGEKRPPGRPPKTPTKLIEQPIDFLAQAFEGLPRRYDFSHGEFL
jgi:hypothetical protein